MEKKTISWWMAGLLGVTLLAQVGTTPSRSDDLRVAVLRDCPVAKGSLESGQGRVELPLDISQVLGGAAARAAVHWVKAQGQAQDSPTLQGHAGAPFYVASNRGELRVNAERWGCLVVLVKDLRGPPPAAPAAASGPVADEHAQHRIYFEARIVHAADRSAFELQPVTLRFREVAQSSFLASSARDLHLDIRFGTPGAAAPFAAAQFSFRALLPSAQKEWGTQALGQAFAKRSGWLPVPPPPAAAVAAVAAYQAPKDPVPERSTALLPTNVTVSLHETREASWLWQAVGGALESWAGTPEAAAPAPVAQ